MNIAAIFDPSVTTSDTFTVPQSSANGKMVVYNESNISLQFSFQSGATAYVPAWTAMLFHGPFGNVNVTWQQQTILMGGGQAPLTQVVVETYDCNEPLPGTYPAALVRQTNIGNAINVATSATSLVNDGNTANTQVIESTVSGDATSAVILTNNAALTLGNASHPASITITGTQGTVTVATDGEVSISRDLLCNLITALASNDLALNVATGHKIALQNNGSDVARITGSGLSVVVGSTSLDNGAVTTDGSGNTVATSLELTGNASKPKISSDTSGNLNIDVPAGTRIMQVNGGGVDLTTASTYDLTAGEVHATSDFKFSNSQTMSKISTFSGTGSGTYNHNLGGSPAIVLPMTNVSGSQTMGYDTVTSTQVHITTGGGLSFKAYCWA